MEKILERIDVVLNLFSFKIKFEIVYEYRDELWICNRKDSKI